MAVELLVKVPDAPVPDGPGKWKKGDVVVVAPARHPWGRLERDVSRFVRIEVTDALASDVADLLEPDEDQNGVHLQRRRLKILDAEIDDAVVRGGIKRYTRVELESVKENRTLQAPLALMQQVRRVLLWPLRLFTT